MLKSIKFIDRNKENPFFLVLSTNAPHGPLHVPEKYTKKYRDKSGVNAERAYFYDLIDAMRLQDSWTWLDVQKPGEYRITVRRWPLEVDVAMGATTPGHAIDAARHEFDNRLMNSPSLPIDVKEVRLSVGETEQKKEVGSDARHVEFIVPLKKGLQKFSSNLITGDGGETAAYYAYIEKVDSR